MASLTGTQINNTYQGLLKTEDNAAVTSGYVALTDGTGTKTGLQVASNAGAYNTIITSDDVYTNGFAVDATGTTFGGAVDFSGATVTGLPGGGGLTGVSNISLTTHAGPDSSDLIFASITIPANTFTAGDIIQIKTMNTQDFTGGGWIYQALWVSNSPALFSGYQIGAAADTSNQSKFYAKSGFIHTANGTGDATSFHGADQDATDQYANGVAPFSDRAVTPIDWTSNVYINASCFVDNAGSSITNRGFNVVKINA